VLQRCFAGLETRQDALWVTPHRPRRFGRLKFAVQYQDQPLTTGDPERVHRPGSRGPSALPVGSEGHEPEGMATVSRSRTGHQHGVPPDPVISTLMTSRRQRS
jgi:hypothetical protein